MKTSIVVAAIVMVAPCLTLAASDSDLESGLTDALRLDKSTMERAADSGKAIQAYMKRGLVGRKPDQRYDYTDYYLLKGQATFKGHQLIVIEEEYMGAFIGCCVSPGAGVTVKVIGSTANLEEFAKNNGCSLTDPVNLQEDLADVGIKTKVPDGHYASLSCRERDLDRQSQP